jgi:tetratricopeptide (TPR) repeat protein
MAATTENTVKALEKRLKKQPRSPLFARLASYYLDAGRTEDALRVCNEGVKHHPFYATGRLIKGKVLLATNNTAEAHSEFAFVHDLLPGVESVANLVSETASAAGVEAPVATPPAEAPQQPEAPATITTVKRVGAKVKHEEEPMAAAVEAPSVAEPTTPQIEEAPPAMEAPPTVETPAAEVPAAPEMREAETFEQFEARMRQELAGTENTLSLEDYISGNIPSQNPGNDIENLAQKLQGAKMTPVIDLSSRTAEGGASASGGFVTPTLAEIYVKQGWYDDAIRAYQTLATTKPEEKDRYEKRIAEIEEMKKQQS